jgi:hypothetical protein
MCEDGCYRCDEAMGPTQTQRSSVQGFQLRMVSATLITAAAIPAGGPFIPVFVRARAFASFRLIDPSRCAGCGTLALGPLEPVLIRCK